ncbi:MAG TPA: hypothetical protein VGK25_03365 [Ignavibacteria bacterium]
MKDKLHIIILFSIIIFFVITGLIVRKALQPESYGVYGNYRWDANEEIISKKMVNQNTKTCGECHNDIYQLHQKDAHYNVPCVDCHGAGNVHVAYYQGDSLKGITKKEAFLEKEYNLEGCLYCHRKLKARPTDFPQIDQKEHYKFLHINDLSTKCIECHSPHEPVFLLTEVNKSRIHPIVYRCTECHDKKPDKSPKEIQNHPTIFECKDCHKEISDDFSKKPHHNYVDCRTCHLYHKENETTGRIYKNGNAKFCLLCHEKKSFKDEKYPPKIEWPSHIGNKKIIAKSDEMICLNCHINQVHKMDLKTKENPHPGNWVNEHKVFARQDKEICIKCHTADKCSSCHMKNKPSSHTLDWPKQHPKFAAANKSSCETCHKKDGCNSCHKVQMPHPKDFDSEHKELATQKGKVVCLNCHKEEFCNECH